MIGIAFSGLVVAVALPLVAPNEYYLTVLASAYIQAVAAVGLNLILGYTGQLNLAHAGFMAIGAYTFAILTVDYGVPYWVAFGVSGIVAGTFGLGAGFLSLRLKADYFAIFTLCVGLIIALLIEKWDRLTHGVVGIFDIPAAPAIGPFRFDNPAARYYLVLAFLVGSLWLMHRIVRSLFGRALMAIRNGERLAEALGIPLMRTKVTAFVISTVYAGYAGALYAGFFRVVGHQLASEAYAFDMIAFILVGGIGTLTGPVVGALMLTIATQSLQFLQEYRLLIFGPLLVLLVMFLPKGLIGTLEARRARRAGARAARTEAAPAKRSTATSHA